ncbi:MAG: GAF domain-containing protein [Polyangiaceae bacterium]|nr:GAF domain-containing protein [Polyangiaceae bacterium]
MRSDPPPEDLKRERDTFIQQFFRRGAQLSEELLGDIERLREQVRDLEAENAKLRAQLASDAAIRDLLRKIEELEEEKRRLIAATTRDESNPGAFADRFAELENELGNLGTVHVASVQLHSSTTVRRAFRSLRDLLAQFLGASQFAVFWETDDHTALVPISVDGIGLKEAREFSLEDIPAGKAYQNGEIWTDTLRDTSLGNHKNPAAVIPITMSSQRLGAIVIFRTLSQKTKFESADFDLFSLLSTQAAPAIVHAYLFAQAGRRAPSVHAFIDQED